MAAIKVDLRRGAYYDSIVLMELQAALMDLPGITNTGVMMGTPANKALLDQNGLLTPEAQAALPEDLIISIEGEHEAPAEAALGQVDALLTRRRTLLDAALTISVPVCPADDPAAVISSTRWAVHGPCGFGHWCVCAVP